MQVGQNRKGFEKPRPLEILYHNLPGAADVELVSSLQTNGLHYPTVARYIRNSHSKYFENYKNIIIRSLLLQYTKNAYMRTEKQKQYRIPRYAARAMQTFGRRRYKQIYIYINNNPTVHSCRFLEFPVQSHPLLMSVTREITNDSTQTNPGTKRYYYYYYYIIRIIIIIITTSAMQRYRITSIVAKCN